MTEGGAQGGAFGLIGSTLAMATKAITVDGSVQAITYGAMGAFSGWLVVTGFKWIIKKLNK